MALRKVHDAYSLAGLYEYIRREAYDEDLEVLLRIRRPEQRDALKELHEYGLQIKRVDDDLVDGLIKFGKLVDLSQSDLVKRITLPHRYKLHKGSYKLH